MTETVPEVDQILALLNKHFETTVLNMLKQIKNGQRTKGNPEHNIWKKAEFQQMDKNLKREPHRYSGAEK